MKNRIINKSVTIIRASASIIVFTMLLSHNANAQDTTYPHQEPIQPENYLYLPSFIEHGVGLDIYENIINRRKHYSAVIGSVIQFDSTIAPPIEAVSQKFMIDSTITIYGIAIFREMIDGDLESWKFEDSLQIRSLNHDTIYRSVSIAYYRKPDFMSGVYEYYFDSLTISTPFTVVKTFSRDHYRKNGTFAATVYGSSGSDPNNFEVHSFQRPSFKHYGVSLWYNMKDDPYPYPGYHAYMDRYSDSIYTDLYMLPIYSKAPEPICNVTVRAEPEGYGTVSGSGSYDMFTYVTIEAIPNENYRFVCWENIPLCDNPQTIRVMGDTVFTAIFDTILPTGIDMAEIGESITLHPNPATASLNIELPGSLKCTAELRNIKGVLIETKQLQGNAQWNIEALPPGVYMLTFRNKDFSITRKFVKK